MIFLYNPIMRTLIKIQEEKDFLSHPGESLKELIDFKGISQKELAQNMGRPEKTISEIITGKAAITTDTALELERALGVSATFWVNRENRYRQKLSLLEQEEREIEEHLWPKTLPILWRKSPRSGKKPG